MAITPAKSDPGIYMVKLGKNKTGAWLRLMKL